MNTPKVTDNKDDEKEETPYLTLADKKPSLIRVGGNSSHRTVSTGVLSDNLQTTRDGLINLMRNKDGNDRLRTNLLSDDGTDYNDENDDPQNFGMNGRGSRSATDKNNGKSGGINRSSLEELTNGQKEVDGNEGYCSEEFFNAARNGHSELSSQNFENGGSNIGLYGIENAQRGKHGSAANDDLERAELAKLFSSQNPRKDGPLYNRIFIDVFLPSLEGNRIFPLYNHRCAEKIERTSKDFHKKRSNKQLQAVSATEDGGKVQREAKEILKEGIEKSQIEEGTASGEENKREDSQEMDRLQEITNLQETSEVEEVKELEKGQEFQKVELEKVVEEGKEVEELIETTENVGLFDHSTLSPLVQHLSSEEDQLFQKIFGALKENEDFIKFICEKVISMLAARNDFCGPNCKGCCGGLNKPSEQSKG